MTKEITLLEYLGTKNRKLHKLITGNTLWDYKVIFPISLDDVAQIAVMIKRENEGKWETYYIKM